MNEEADMFCVVELKPTDPPRAESRSGYPLRTSILILTFALLLGANAYLLILRPFVAHV